VFWLCRICWRRTSGASSFDGRGVNTSYRVAAVCEHRLRALCWQPGGISDIFMAALRRRRVTRRRRDGMPFCCASSPCASAIDVVTSALVVPGVFKRHHGHLLPPPHRTSAGDRSRALERAFVGKMTALTYLCGSTFALCLLHIVEDGEPEDGVFRNCDRRACGRNGYALNGAGETGVARTMRVAVRQSRTVVLRGATVWQGTLPSDGRWCGRLTAVGGGMGVDGVFDDVLTCLDGVCVTYVALFICMFA